VAQTKQVWQSKLVLLAVLPFAGADVVLETHWWATQVTPVAIWTVGMSLLLGLVTWKLHAATPRGAVAGTAITASLMFSTVALPYEPWHTALMPVLAVALLAFVSTRLGRGQKERLGTAEGQQGRSASQVAANLGVAALVSSQLIQSWFVDSQWFARAAASPTLMFSVGLAALAEAAADTASSEVGQVIGGRPRMITTLRQVEPGRDGAVSLAGTTAGVVAAAIVAAAGTLALRGDQTMFAVSCAGGVFGLLFDSLLGATLEERGWLNNDAVNFLSTGSAAGFALVLLALLPLFLKG
jgi:uncharacterized protein (TIGR00297 family)